MDESETKGQGERHEERYAATGIPGLDDVIEGGLTRKRVYLLEGDPGCGKTTAAIQWLLAGRARGERTLHVTLAETAAEIRDVARSHGWDLDEAGIEIFELNVTEESLSAEGQYTVFHPSEVELSATVRRVLEVVERLQPSRVVFDSLSELRLLAQEPLRYRRQILALKQFFSGRGATLLFIDDKMGQEHDPHLHSVVHGVISLERLTPEYGTERRRLQIIKMRGRSFRAGYHDFRIGRGGIEVFPRLVAADHVEAVQWQAQDIGSGKPDLDRLFGGGITRGTSTLLLGPTGAGKTTLAVTYAHAALQRGDRALIYTFDESRHILRERTKAFGMDLAQYEESGMLHLQQIDPAEISPGEFAASIQRHVEANEVKIVVIDSLNGYINAMPDERHLLLHLHELFTYLGHRGVTTMLVITQAGLFAHSGKTPVDVSYLADSVVLLRHFEAKGQIRKAIAMMKKRSGTFEPSVHEFGIGPRGIEIGDELTNYQGVLAGVPSFGMDLDPGAQLDEIG